MMIIYQGRCIQLASRLPIPASHRHSLFAPPHRNVMTTPFAPPLEATERPVRIVLGEDAVTSCSTTSWKVTCRERFPLTHNMPFQNFTWPQSEASNDANHQFDSPAFDMDAALSELSQGLHASSTGSQTVFIAKGPWISWLSLFYLESLPLAGLVLVDPLPLHQHQTYVNQFELYYQNHKHSADYKLFQDYMQHWDHWSLQLEPGAVPMVVLSTMTRNVWRRAAQETSQQHSGSVFGNVPVLEMLPALSRIKRNDNVGSSDTIHYAYVEHVVDVLADWVVDRVL
ncbi:hypothetical protein MPSEU_000640500 [Mayamaea pseudoterrestris]|nr:hypothetical protein MPSEU_000640500 [Mayamaea pseudoterrestris]